MGPSYFPNPSLISQNSLRLPAWWLNKDQLGSAWPTLWHQFLEPLLSLLLARCKEHTRTKDSGIIRNNRDFLFFPAWSCMICSLKNRRLSLRLLCASILVLPGFSWCASDRSVITWVFSSASVHPEAFHQCLCNLWGWSRHIMLHLYAFAMLFAVLRTWSHVKIKPIMKSPIMKHSCSPMEHWGGFMGTLDLKTLIDIYRLVV